MNFYYIDAAGQAAGPVPAEALVELRRSGAIRDGSRVSREGDAVWRTFGDFFRPSDAAAEGADEAAPMPVAMRVFGIGNIVFGALGLLCLPLTVVWMAMVCLAGHQAGCSAVSAWRSGWFGFSAVFGVFLSVALLAGGIGLVRRRGWGRLLTLVYAWTSVAHTLVSFGMALSTEPNLAKAEPSSLWTQAFYAALVALGLAYPILLLAYLSRRSSRAALAERE